jgi:hypothetical protein
MSNTGANVVTALARNTLQPVAQGAVEMFPTDRSGKVTSRQYHFLCQSWYLSRCQLSL